MAIISERTPTYFLDVIIKKYTHTLTDTTNQPLKGKSATQNLHTQINSRICEHVISILPMKIESIEFEIQRNYSRIFSFTKYFCCNYKHSPIIFIFL